MVIDSKQIDETRRLILLAVLWLAVLAVATVLMVALRARLDQTHVVLVYLLVVLGASAQAGRAIGFSAAVLTFLLFNFFFLPPYHTFTLAHHLDWIVLIAYLVTATVAAALLTRAQREAAERVRLAALRETDRLKDAVIAAVSHDLRTPLTSIKALAYDIATEGDERARIIGVEAERLNRFVAGLLDLSALNSGALRLNLEVNTIEDAIGSAIAQVAATINGRKLDARVAHDVLTARFDFVYTVRIIANLLENAHKYSPAEAPVTVMARRSNRYVEIAVTDRGAGISAGERENIFQPFYRPRNAPPDASSAGLGLAIARRLAEAQGGELTLETSSSVGSTFILRLPAVELAPVS